MGDPKRHEERQEGKDLELDEQSVTDMDVTDEDAEEAKGGMMAEMPSTSRTCLSRTGCR